MRHSCRQTPLLVTWVGVCIAKDSLAKDSTAKSGGHRDAVEGRADEAFG